MRLYDRDLEVAGALLEEAAATLGALLPAAAAIREMSLEQTPLSKKGADEDEDLLAMAWPGVPKPRARSESSAGLQQHFQAAVRRKNSRSLQRGGSFVSLA